MRKALVTGAAGFIGSHLVERLLDEGYAVTGLDGWLDNYDLQRKRAHLERALAHDAFHLVQGDLCTIDLEPLLDGAEAVFHLAGLPGVRKSWGTAFADYTRHNIDATQRLLEAASRHPVRKLVLASTSSVYGNVPVPMREDGPVRPVSPYGVTKLAAEHLAYLYFSQLGVPAVAVRYFTVYGPRQRPDMAFSRFIASALAGDPIVLYGGGHLKRDFTYVSDAVSGTVLAAEKGVPGEVYNIGGGACLSLLEVASILEDVVGRLVKVHLDDTTPRGDMHETWADTSKARAQLGYAPAVDIRAGLAQQVTWVRQQGPGIPGGGPGAHRPHLLG